MSLAQYGMSAEKEIAAYLLDHEGFAGVLFLLRSFFRLFSFFKLKQTSTWFLEKNRKNTKNQSKEIERVAFENKGSKFPKKKALLCMWRGRVFCVCVCVCVC